MSVEAIISPFTYREWEKAKLNGFRAYKSMPDIAFQGS